MQCLSQYTTQQQEIIVRFGIRFFSCIEEAKDQSLSVMMPMETPQSSRLDYGTNIVYGDNQDHQLANMLSSFHIQQLEQNKTLVAKLDKVLCTSSTIGQQGEFLVERALMQQYPQAIITNTSKVPNSGDFIVQLQDKRILIEVKNYSKTVDQREVGKFLSDVNTSQCDCAIFIAFEQRIANKPRISFEMTDSGKQVVFLSQQEGTDSLLVIIELMSQVLHNSHLNIDKMQKQHEIARLALVDSIASIKKQYTQTNNQLKQIKSTWDQLLSIEESMRLSIA